MELLHLLPPKEQTSPNVSVLILHFIWSLYVLTRLFLLYGFDNRWPKYIVSIDTRIHQGQILDEYEKLNLKKYFPCTSTILYCVRIHNTYPATLPSEVVRIQMNIPSAHTLVYILFHFSLRFIIKSS